MKLKMTMMELIELFKKKGLPVDDIYRADFSTMQEESREILLKKQQEEIEKRKSH